MARHQPRINIKSTSYYQDFDLSKVCTITEACVTWRKSRTAIENALTKGQIQGRQSFTGGEYLISVDTMIYRYGKPKDFTLFELWESADEVHPIIEEYEDHETNSAQ